MRRYKRYWKRGKPPIIAVLVYDYGFPDVSEIPYTAWMIESRIRRGGDLPYWITPVETTTPEYVAIVGSRFNSHTHEQREIVRLAVLEYVKALPKHMVIVSGAANGVDTWAAQAARDCGLEVIEYPAEWARYGRSAGFRRNADIVNSADRVVAFWDGKSRGTNHSIDLARKQGKPVKIVKPLEETPDEKIDRLWQELIAA